MKDKKMVLIFVLAILVLTPMFTEEVRQESSVESVYLQSNEDLIITELAETQNYEAKLLSLQFIQEAVNAGRVTPAMEKAIHTLAGSGVLNMSRTAGRLDNNFPDVRRDAVIMLAEIPSVESKDMILDLMDEELEPMVLSAAVYSLGEIGINEGDDVISSIAQMHTRFSVLNPTDSLANSILYAYEKLIPVTENQTIMVESLTNIATNYKYIIPVREKAASILKTIMNN